MAGNQDQIAYWNGKAGETWVQAQDRIDRTLADLTEQALADAMPREGEWVLDVGCGCGTTSLAIGERGANVLGLDISAPMLAFARERSSALPGVTFEQGDAASWRFGRAFDLIFSRFGVMFFDDPVSAFANLKSALAPSGRMTFLCWRAPGENPWMSTAGRVVQPWLAAANPGAAPPDPRAPGPFAFSDRDWVLEILVSAGFGDVRFDVASAEITVGRTVDEAMTFQSEIGPLARAISELEGDARDQALAAVRAEFEKLLTPDGLKLGASAWIVSARPA